MVCNISDNDITYFEKIRESNEEAFSILFRKYYEPLYYFAGRFIRDPQFAENAVQDVFVKIWIQRDQLAVKTNVKAYLYTAVKNHLLNILKQEKKLTSIDNFSDLSGDSSPENNHVKDEVKQAVLKAIDELPPKCKKIFIMHRYDDLKYNEIAEILGISINTVKTQIKRALKTLHKKLEYLIILLVIVFII